MTDAIASRPPDAASGGGPAAVKIRLRGIHKSFGNKRVLDGIDLDIFEGESTVVIGDSGTGKSVLLKHLIGLLKPDRGTVEVDGVRVNRLGHRQIAEFRQRFGMAFQEGALFDSMTVAENISFPLRRARIFSKAEIRDRVEECLEQVHLPGIGKKMPSELSGGMRRRVGFARAIARRPAILLFDEPTTGLDPLTKRTIDDLIVELNDVLGSTTVTISHDMPSVFRIADRIGMLFEGKIIAFAPPEELRRLDDRRVQEFVRGEPAAEAPA